MRIKLWKPIGYRLSINTNKSTPTNKNIFHVFCFLWDFKLVIMQGLGGVRVKDGDGFRVGLKV